MFISLCPYINAWLLSVQLLATYQITVLVVVPVQLMHRIAEQRAVLRLALVLSYQLSLLLTRSCKNRTNCGSYFRKASLSRSLRHRRFLRGRVTQLAGRHFAGLLVRAEIHIAVLAHLFLHALDESHGLDFCHNVKVGLMG